MRQGILLDSQGEFREERLKKYEDKDETPQHDGAR
jgi:hypothetical protein